ncbi:hypothetical protein RBH19_00660 [Natronospira sp. AB-CW4]|uniref:Uncharacterized protein n=1 Tax=Natronospira bacteriovora TaxID=3069753 RepID=A0ABU0W2Y5_9GAMM|nr:hypothetical protein [Natronospira sp. AB-CW4]MDQ2068382.1 hypothetical protein [Natronospira sp. AB-CW4]
MAFQLLSHYEPRENGEATPFDDPRVTSITVDNRHAGTREEIEGDVVSKPDCPSGSEATIQPRVREVDGTAFGRIQLNAENRNGEWQIMASGLLSGLARIHAEVEVDCRSTANEEPE